MRGRSRKNSKKWEDIEFRKDYMSRHPRCELAPHLLRLGVKGVRGSEKSCDPHHIFGGAGRRWDTEQNLLAVSRVAHDWCHANPKEGRVLGLWIKVRSGVIDRDEFRRVTGKTLEGFLSLNRPVGAILLEMHDELTRIFDT